jgi:DNA-binding GntR family transcriptional regulator
MAADDGTGGFFVEPLPSAPSLRHHIATSLQRGIIEGEIRPGDLLSVPTLAARFGTSVTPVREAMLDLERRKFVESVKNRGFLVTAPSRDRVIELVNIRSLLEPPIMRELAGRISDAEYPRLRRLADDVADHLHRGDRSARAEAELAFHHALIDLYGSPVLTEMVMDLRLQGRVPDSAPETETARQEQVLLDHTAIIDHLEAGRGDEAADLLHRHIRRVIDWFAEDEAAAGPS